MLTSYMVHCPDEDCGWFGSLLPRQDTDSWKSSIPTAANAVFECPQCGRVWSARIQGDDVFPIEEEEHIYMV